MKRTIPKLCLVALVLVAPVVLAQGFKVISEVLTGYQEVPAVSTAGGGVFHARISNDEQSIQWDLAYSNLEGAVQQSHIHLGNPGGNGGILGCVAWNIGNATAGTHY